MMKPSNCQPSLKDKIIQTWWDLSVGLALAAVDGRGNMFMDPFTDYQVIAIHVTPTVTLSGTATILKIGTQADDDHFCNVTDVTVVAGNRVVGVVQRLTLTSTVLLPHGTVLTAKSTGTADTGEAIVTVTLRPVDTKYSSSKRPGGAAQATA